MQRYAKYRHYLHKHRLVQGLMRHWRNIPKGTLIKNTLLLGLGVFFLGALFLLAAYAWYSRELPDPNGLLDRNIELSTKIYDRTGEHLLYEIAGNKKRTLVTLEQIPDDLERAVIAAEDANFYSHHGISIKGILRAVIYQGRRGGGSTITQQLVKNAILSPEKTFDRKFKEIILSIALEQRFTKEQILQMYFNEIGYGGRNYGVESAAQAYYQKSASELTLAQSATLAGLPQLPTTYLNNLDLLKERRDWILGRMVELGYITQEQADVATVEDIGITVAVSDISAPHFVMWVKEQLVDTYGEREVEEGGLRVTTTLDYAKQLVGEQAVLDGVTARGETYKYNNGALMALDPRTGQVLTMVGSVDYFNDEIDGQVNVTLRPRQPGSSIKPIVYTAAFGAGYTPNTLIWDVITTFSTVTGPYTPHNYDYTSEHGYVTMRKALQGSLNIPAVKTLYLVGLENALGFAEKLGYTTFGDRSRIGLSFALGGNEVTMIEHINAYAAFANNGLQHEVVSILKVENAKGEVLQEWTSDDHPGEQVIESNLAATITNVLSDNNARAYIFSTSNYLNLGSRPVAAKTGTTNNYNDAWTLGYTPSLVAAVWTGNTDGTEMNRGADSSKTAAPIWNAFMSKALEGTPIETFSTPTIPNTGKNMLDGTIPTTTYTIDTASGKLATERTPERFREEKTCGEYHTILKYVDRSNPTGDEPNTPESDPYYTTWEAAVQEYVTRKNAELENGEEAIETCGEIPTEEDDVHTERNEPKIDIETPDSGDEVGRTFDVEVEVETKRDFSRVEYLLDGALIATSGTRDGTTITLPSWVDVGAYELTATVYDDVDNSASDNVRIKVDEEGGSTTFHITNPFDDQTIEKTSSTYDVIIEVPDVEEITYLEISVRNMWTGETSVAGSSSSPSAITSITWNLPDAARYRLIARATAIDGSTRESTPIVVRVKEILSVPVIETTP